MCRFTLVVTLVILFCLLQVPVLSPLCFATSIGKIIDTWKQFVITDLLLVVLQTWDDTERKTEKLLMCCTCIMDHAELADDDTPPTGIAAMMLDTQSAMRALIFLLNPSISATMDFSALEDLEALNEATESNAPTILGAVGRRMADSVVSLLDKMKQFLVQKDKWKLHGPEVRNGVKGIDLALTGSDLNEIISKCRAGIHTYEKYHPVLAMHCCSDLMKNITLCMKTSYKNFFYEEAARKNLSVVSVRGWSELVEDFSRVNLFCSEIDTWRQIVANALAELSKKEQGDEACSCRNRANSHTIVVSPASPTSFRPWFSWQEPHASQTPQFTMRISLVCDLRSAVLRSFLSCFASVAHIRQPSMSATFATTCPSWRLLRAWPGQRQRCRRTRGRTWSTLPP